MSRFGNLGLRIRRRETPLTDWLYRTLKALYRAQSPVIPVVHPALFWARALRHQLWERLTKGLYYEPMFRTLCETAGPGLTIGDYGGSGMPCVVGNLRIHIGRDVHLADRTTFAGAKVFDDPILRIGDYTTIGPGVQINVGRAVTIGSHSMIGAQLIADNPGHPMMDVLARIRNEPFHPSEARPVTIGDFVWIPPHATYVLPGSKIGDGCILMPGTRVGGMDVPPFCLVGGNPAQIHAKLPLPKGLKDIVGDERYEAYREAHRSLKLHGGRGANAAKSG